MFLTAKWPTYQLNYLAEQLDPQKLTDILEVMSKGLATLQAHKVRWECCPCQTPHLQSPDHVKPSSLSICQHQLSHGYLQNPNSIWQQNLYGFRSKHNEEKHKKTPENLKKRCRDYRMSGTLMWGMARCWSHIMILEANWIPAMFTLCPNFDNMDFFTFTPSFTSESGPFGSSWPISTETLIVVGTSEDSEDLPAQDLASC